jgi:hypothetical protein
MGAYALLRPSEGPPPCMKQHPVMQAPDHLVPVPLMIPACSLAIDKGGDVWAVNSRSTRAGFIPRASPVREKVEVSA